MTNNQTAAAQSNGQTTNTKGEVKMMTNKAMNFVLVNSKEVVSVSTREKVVFPVQVRMTLEVNGKNQSVAFGYNRLGGRQTYVVADGKAPAVMSRADFMKKLRAVNILNMKQVEKALSHLRAFHKDEFIVAKCECCGTGLVTAANIDFIQRSHAKLSEKLGREVTAFSKLCYTCQGHDGKPAPKKEKPEVIPASAEKATCSHCSKEVSQKVAQFSLKTYGRILCFKPCQTKYPKLDNKQQEKKEEPAKSEAPVQESQPPVNQHQEQAIVKNRDELLTPELVAEIMALEVDRYSAIAKLQEKLASLHQDDMVEQHVLWGEVHAEHVLAIATEQAHQEAMKMMEGASEASASPLMLISDCQICDAELPPVDAWNYDVCASCTIEQHEDPNSGYEVYPAHLQAAQEYLMDASAASDTKEEAVMGEASEASPDQEEAREDVAKSEEDAKEVPQAESTDETVCKSPESLAVSSISPVDEVNEMLFDAAHSFQDSDVPPMPESDSLPW